METTHPRMRYLESFDSTRYPLDSVGEARAKRVLQSEVELLLAWLFGDTVPVPEAYSVDSTGFLDIADAVVEAKPKEGLGKFPPFRLAVRSVADRPEDPAAHLSYLDVAALQFHSPMLLSGWPSLQQDPSTRKAVASALDRRDLESAKQTVSPQEKTNLECMERLDRYFEVQQRYSVHSTPELLQQFTSSLRSFAPSTVGSEMEGAARLKQAVSDFESLDVSLSNRSEIRLAKERYMQLPTADETAYNDLIDYIDTAYNMVVGHSLRAESSIYTSRQFEKPGKPFVGETLARKIQREVLGRNASLDEQPLIVLEPPNVDVGPDKATGEYKRVKWGVVWDLLQSGDFQDQLRALRKAALRYERASSGQRRAHLREIVEKELEKHLRLIGTVAHPYIIERQQLSIRVLLEMPRRRLQFSRDSAGTGAVQALIELVSGGVGLAGVVMKSIGVAVGGLAVRDEDQRRLEGVVQHLRRHVRLR